MAVNRVLALSSSSVYGGSYLQAAAPLIHKFLGEKGLTIAFIPFADVAEDHEIYANKVRAALVHLPHTIVTVTMATAKDLLEKAEVIMVGGGNTFKLLHDIYDCQVLDTIRNKVNKGTPYIGWSAGANITAPTIGTTNDMPIIAPKSFNALGLLPFQINPHYTNILQEGHHGETRNQRIEEFMAINPGLPVVALPEGTALQLEGDQLYFKGAQTGVLFFWEAGETMTKRAIAIEEDLSFLL